MKAEDTVMGNKKLQLLGQQYEDDLPTYDLNHYLLLAQAELSFKAGYGQSILDNDNWAKETYGYKLGREELKKQIEGVKANAFSVSLCDGREHQVSMQAMINAYDVCLNIIKEMEDE